MEALQYMVPGVAVVVITGEVPECQEAAVVMAAAEADHPMQIRRLHQPLPILEEITTPTVIVQLLGQVQVADPHCSRSQ